MPAAYRILHADRPKSVSLVPFGLVLMDNGEIALFAARKEGKDQRPVISFSEDSGNTWSPFRQISDAGGQPIMAAFLGKGALTFVANERRYFSRDYGRTWLDSVPVQQTASGQKWRVEGNPLVEMGADGKAMKLAEIGFTFTRALYPAVPAEAYIRWSEDEGRTWKSEEKPEAWRWSTIHEKKILPRGVSEGSLLRAANGWLVAALRTDLSLEYMDLGTDYLEGTAVSVSKDNGKAWSPLEILFPAGRHHAHLLRLPGGEIVMTLIVRADARNGGLASYMRGCEAIISRDNGLTWDRSRRYVLDSFNFYDGTDWYRGECGHLSSVLLEDGSVMTAYGNYHSKGISLIRWKP